MTEYDSSNLMAFASTNKGTFKGLDEAKTTALAFSNL